MISTIVLFKIICLVCCVCRKHGKLSVLPQSDVPAQPVPPRHGEAHDPPALPLHHLPQDHEERVEPQGAREEVPRHPSVTEGIRPKSVNLCECCAI
jgi:hypothetical protein